MATVGVVGLGHMGLPLALCLRDAGFSVVTWSRGAGSRDAAAAEGLTVLASPAEVATAVRASSGVVITSLPAGPEVRAICLGDDGLLASTGPARLVLLDTSTCAPADSRALAAELAGRGAGAVDAPVSGGPTAARAGSLSVMVGGSDEDVAAARPVLEAVAGRLTVCGPAGSGQVAKACNQLLVTVGLAAVSEALLLASALGADPAQVRQALLGGYAASRVLDLHGDRMLRRDFAPGGPARLHLKDIGIIRDLAAGQVPLEVFEQAAAAIEELVAGGGGELDHSAVLTVVERKAGRELS